jgi:osmotically-inducible protein OsmY
MLSSKPKVEVECTVERERFIMKTDAEIQQAVLRELRWDPRVDETDVGVEVDAGVVTLTGTVDSYTKRVAAQEAAHRVTGVLDVANDVQVHIPGSLARTDTEIARAVRHALKWHAYVPDHIQSTVTDGIVTLEGRVSLWHQRDAAERALRHLLGVRRIINKIELAGATVDPRTVQAEIEGALERRAEREAKRIRVSVHDGRVSLSGTVRSWAEKEAVLGAARFTTGVTAVEDHLEVTPQSGAAP